MIKLLKLSLCFVFLHLSPLSANELQLFFNRNESLTYWDPYRNIERSGENIEIKILQLIDSAKERVWMSAYELRLPLIARALKAAAERGVDIRVVTDNQNNYLMSDLDTLIPDASDYEVGRLKDYFAYTDLNRNGVLEQSEIQQMDALKILKDAAIPIVDDTEDDSKGSGLMHHKFLVIDSSFVFTASGNFTWSDFHGDKLAERSRGNANNFLIFENTNINKVFAEEFLILWGDGPGGLKNSKFGVKKTYRAPITTTLTDGTKVSIQFGATSKTYGFEASPNGFIGSYLENAQESVEAALFVWSEQRLTNLTPSRLFSRLSVLSDSFFAYRAYSEILDLLGVEMLGENCKIEKDNKPWARPSISSGSVKLTPGDLLHHKFGVIDSQIVITGSQNWSASANENNDEVVIVIESKDVATQYQQEFQRIKKFASLGVTAKLKDKIEAEKQRCAMPPSASFKFRLR